MVLLFSFNGLSSQAVIQILSSESEVKGMFISEKGFSTWTFLLITFVS